MDYLPTLKDEEGSPQALPRGNDPFTEIELCNVIQTALPFSFASAFWATKGAKHFPVSVQTLKQDLELVFPNYAITAKLVAQAEREREKSAKKQTQNGDSGSNSKKQTMDDPIPRKPKPDNKKNPSKGQNQDLVAGGPSAGATDNNSPLKARFEDGRELPKSFMSTEELLSPLEPEPEKKKASESLLKAFMNSKPESAREQQAQEVISVYRDITLTNANIKQMLAILF